MLGLIAAAMVFTRSVQADPLVLPFKLAVQVMLKVLTYDRNLTARGAGPFTLLVVYESAQTAERDKVLSVAEDLRGSTESGRLIRFVPFEFHAAALIREAIHKEQATALLVLPGVSTEGAATIVATGRETKVYTLTLDPALVQSGVLLGVEMQDGRPHILLNQSAARAADAVFESTVLKLARVVGG